VTPDRSGYEPNFSKTVENDKLDIGWNEGVMSDGRPYRMEAWAWDQTTSLTFFTSMDGLPDRSKEDWATLLETERLVQFGNNGRRTAYAVPITDSGNQAMWSINVMVGAEDELYVEDSIAILPYDRGDTAADEPIRQRSDDLADLANDPDFLIGRGFRRTQEETTDVVRWVRFSRHVQGYQTQLRLVVVIEFSLYISDQPDPSYENESYSFEGGVSRGSTPANGGDGEQ
jgi:hypothetical protein